MSAELPKWAVQLNRLSVQITGVTAVARLDGVRGWIVLPDGLGRICDDFDRTTGHALTLRPAADHWFDKPMLDVLLDGTSVGVVGLPCWANADKVVAEVADNLQEQFLDEFIWGGWPTCPAHHTHSLQAVMAMGLPPGTVPRMVGLFLPSAP